MPGRHKLKVGLDRDRKGSFLPETTLEGDRRQRVGFVAVGPEGTLFFETAVTDWSLSLNIAGLFGKRDIRARILNSKDGEITQVLQPITIDPDAPKNLKIVAIGGVPVNEGTKSVQVTPSATLPVIVEGIDPESGIEKVSFYLGKPKGTMFDPAVPMKEGEPLNPERTRWEARLPADREGTIDLTIRFENKVGMASLSPTIGLLVQKEEDPKDKEKKVKPGSIYGVVREGDRPQMLKVSLIDVKADANEKPKFADTDANGRYEFKDLKPGSYKVASQKAGRVAEQTVVVTPGNETKADLSLLLK